MKKVIIIDSQELFLDDISTRMMLDDDRDLDVVTTLKSVENIRTALMKFQPDELVVADNMIKKDDWDYSDVKITAYARNATGLELVLKNKIACYGIINSADTLLDCIESGKLTEFTEEDNKPKEPVKKPQANKEVSEKPSRVQSAEQIFDDDEVGLIEMDDTPAPRKPQPVRKENPVRQEPIKPEPVRQEPKREDDYNERNEYNDNRSKSNYSNSTQNTVTEQEPVIEEEPQPKKKKEESKHIDIRSKLNEARETRLNNEGNTALEEIFAQQKKKAECIAVYASKGGVGKTTISCELATMLAMTCNGREHYKVCIIDYNIDFGDVLTTLNFRNDGVNMNFWADEIKERLKYEEKEDITYTQSEIEERLQRNESGLYALIAPLAHEDSMIIGEEELEVMISNIIENGGFDYVICDTGNNTRDSSVLALEYADKILITITQDVTAANCTYSFLNTMKKVNFDLSKVYLVINNIASSKETGITVKELEDSFSYPCVARFRRNMDVCRANNLGKPLVENPNHEFTKEMKRLVAFITGRSDLQTEVKGNKFLNWFKK